MSRSGQCYDKQQTVDALKLESGYPQIFSEGFKLTMMVEDIALLRYQSFMLDDDGQEIRHTDR